MIKNPFNLKCLKIFSLIFLLSFLTNDLYAQAGTSGTLEICTKETYDEGNGLGPGRVDLNLIITGESGTGTWTESTTIPCAPGGGLSPNGTLNTWAIRRGCVYTYTFTSDVDGSTSTVTLTLGGFPGVGENGNVCDDNADVNLFGFLGNSPNPDALNVPPFEGGGVFSTTCTLPGLISGNTFNATLPDPDNPDPCYPNYPVCYTVPATATCPERQTCFIVTINPKPEPGSTMTLNLCENDDLSAYANFDLRTLFNATPIRDLGGIWEDTTAAPFGPASTTNGLGPNPNFESDTTINIPGILNDYLAAGNGNDLTHLDQDLVLTFEYTVYPTHPICEPEEKATFTITIERVIDLTGGSISATPVGVCQNDTAPVININQNTLYPVEDGSYDITYTISGVNPGPGGTATATFTAGIGVFTPPLTLSTANVGRTTICITSAIENGSAVDLKCSRAILPNVCGFYDVFAAPDPSDTRVVVDDICRGNAVTATIRDINPGNGIQLAPGNYTVDYTLTAPATGGTSAQFTVDATGTGSFDVPGITVAGTYTITITSFTNVDTNCVSVPTSISDEFEVFENPDASLISAIVADVCEGTAATVIVSGITPAAIYDITYSIDGGGSQTATSVSLPGGVFPLALLSTGPHFITITNIRNVAGCQTATNLRVDFNVKPTPNASDITVTIDPVCAGQPTNVHLTDGAGAPDLTNDTYTVTYNISGSNTATNQTASVVFTTAGGGSFPITLANAGSTVITITSITSSGVPPCSAIGVPRIGNITVDPLPTITSANLDATDICQNDATGALVTITGLSGNYTINYDISGANTASGQSVTTNIPATPNDTFYILAGASNAGSTTITITSIVDNATGCTATLSGVTNTFNVNANPVINTGEFTVDDICLGNSATVSIGTPAAALGIPNGTYTINYNIDGPNGPASYTAVNAIISGGSGTFTIPSSNLLISGINNTITITGLTNEATPFCSSMVLSATDSFDITAAADVSPATLTISNIPMCANTTATVAISGASMLTPGSYTFDYSASAPNATVSGSGSINIDAAGNSVAPHLTIPGGFPNAGSTTLILDNFVSVSGGCPSFNQMTSAPFVVIQTPEPTLVAGGNIFCVVNGPTIAELSVKMTPNDANNVITFYDTPTGGTPLAPATLLVHLTTYYATLTANGCESDRIPVMVDLSDCEAIVIPDGFSPNEDGLNETFDIKFIDILYPAYVLEIYNRYGSMVYTGNINTPKFNGKPTETTVMGKDVLPVGVYFYILYYNDAANTKPVQGRLYLSR